MTGTPISDPQSIAFCNQVIRPLADAFGKLYYAAELAAQQFTAKGLSATIPNDATAVVVDGSASDGRTQITGADVNILLSNMNAFVSTAQANTNLILNQTAKIWVNP